MKAMVKTIKAKTLFGFRWVATDVGGQVYVYKRKPIYIKVTGSWEDRAGGYKFIKKVNPPKDASKTLRRIV